MTEAEWLSHSNPWPMLDVVRARISDRKLWLFAIACCRRVQHLLRNPADRNLIEITEAVAEGAMSRPEWEDTLRRSEPVSEPNGDPGNTGEQRAAFAVAQLLLVDAYDAAVAAPFHAWAATQLKEGPEAPAWFYRIDGNPSCFGFYGKYPQYHPERAEQANLLRCLTGNPFRSVAFLSVWRTSTAVALARGMYESRDFSVMPILADALQDAGCDNTDILAHCQQPGPRGCSSIWCWERSSRGAVAVIRSVGFRVAHTFSWARTHSKFG